MGGEKMINHLLACLAEECGETTQMVGKSLRFGIDDHHPKYGDIPNHDLISGELGDIFGVVDMLLHLKVLNPDIIAARRAAKPEKIMKYIGDAI